MKTAVFPGTELTVRWLEPAGAVRGVVVLCHGFGAPGTDLVGLASEFCRARPELADGLVWAFPEAPLTPPEMAMFGGRAWWPLDTGKIERMLRAGKLRDLANDEPPGLGPARRKLTAVLDALLRRFDLPMSQLVVGGFSQGAMLATETTLRLEEAPAALIVMSGTLLNAANWSRWVVRRRGLKVLQSHGERDPLLPFFGAEALRELLTQGGCDVTFVPFPGEHTISSKVVAAVAETLCSVYQKPRRSD